MKVTSIEFHPAKSPNVAVLSFRDPSRTNRYNAIGLTGLDADEIVPRQYGGPGSFHNLALQKRDIVASIQLNPNFGLNETYDGLRDDLYRLISSSRTGAIQVQFKNGFEVVAAVSGFVTKFEAAHFEKQPGVKLTISCIDPMLRALNPEIIPLGNLDPAATTIVDPKSTAPHGFLFAMSFAAVKPSFKMRDPLDSSWSFEVTPAGGFLVNDVLHFSSEHNNKYLYIQRGANKIHLADVITMGSVWPILFPGSNAFVVDNVTTDANGVRSVSWALISHYPTYWGV